MERQVRIVLTYVIKRLGFSLLLLFLITVMAYGIINLTPGDPISMLVNPEQMNLSAEAVQARREALGLDQPLPVRYLIWLREAITGNLGYSFVTRDAVGPLILQRLRATGELVLVALGLIVMLAIPLGILAAVYRKTWIDYTANALTLFAVSVPSFFLGLGLIYVCSLKLGLLPTAGMQTLGREAEWWDHLKHLILPATTLALLSGADVMRYARAGMLEVLGLDYIRTARAKGVPERAVILRHALRNGVLPLITVLGLRIPQLLGGAVITETIFQWPGMGMLSVQAIQSRDYPVLMGVILMAAVIVVVVNLVTDLVYGWVDPRISLEGGAGAA